MQVNVINLLAFRNQSTNKIRALPPSDNQETVPERSAAHIDSTVQRLRSYLQYIGLIKYAKANETLQHTQEINLA